VAVAFSMNAFAQARHGILPPGYQAVASINLQEAASESNAVYRFHLDKPQRVELILTLENIDTAYIEVSMVDALGETWGILHADDFVLSYDHVRWEETLDPGDYHVRIDSPQSPGLVTLYVHH
jgi:hypothetical protein